MHAPTKTVYIDKYYLYNPSDGVRKVSLEELGNAELNPNAVSDKYVFICINDISVLSIDKLGVGSDKINVSSDFKFNGLHNIVLYPIDDNSDIILAFYKGLSLLMKDTFNVYKSCNSFSRCTPYNCLGYTSDYIIYKHGFYSESNSTLFYKLNINTGNEVRLNSYEYDNYFNKLINIDGKIYLITASYDTYYSHFFINGIYLYNIYLDTENNSLTIGSLKSKITKGSSHYIFKYDSTYFSDWYHIDELIIRKCGDFIYVTPIGYQVSDYTDSDDKGLWTVAIDKNCNMIELSSDSGSAVTNVVNYDYMNM